MSACTRAGKPASQFMTALAVIAVALGAAPAWLLFAPSTGQNTKPLAAIEISKEQLSSALARRTQTAVVSPVSAAAITHTSAPYAFDCAGASGQQRRALQSAPVPGQAFLPALMSEWMAAHNASAAAIWLSDAARNPFAAAYGAGTQDIVGLDWRCAAAPALLAYFPHEARPAERLLVARPAERIDQDIQRRAAIAKAGRPAPAPIRVRAASTPELPDAAKTRHVARARTQRPERLNPVLEAFRSGATEPVRRILKPNAITAQPLPARPQIARAQRTPSTDQLAARAPLRRASDETRSTPLANQSVHAPAVDGAASATRHPTTRLAVLAAKPEAAPGKSAHPPRRVAMAMRTNPVGRQVERTVPAAPAGTRQRSSDFVPPMALGARTQIVRSSVRLDAEPENLPLTVVPLPDHGRPPLPVRKALVMGDRAPAKTRRTAAVRDATRADREERQQQRRRSVSPPRASAAPTVSRSTKPTSGTKKPTWKRRVFLSDR